MKYVCFFLNSLHITKLFVFISHYSGITKETVEIFINKKRGYTYAHQISIILKDREFDLSDLKLQII